MSTLAIRQRQPIRYTVDAMRRRPNNVAVQTASSPRIAARLITAALLWFTAAIHAQYDPPTVTLHVYENLVQVPVLVLSDSRQPLPPIELQRFTLSLNSGRPFRPTHVRREGNDPIDLSILFDLHSGGRGFLVHLPEALAALVHASIRPQDRVTLYTLGCDLTRYTTGSLPDASAFREEAETVIRKNKQKSERHCAQPAHLWDTMAYIARVAPSAPARPVLLVLTDGSDDGSSMRRSQLGTFAAAKSLTIFALTRPDRCCSNSEDPLTAVCDYTGGTIFSDQPEKLPDALVRFIALVRDRYIVSFPRPDTLTTGPPVQLKVSLLDRNAFIRISGIEVPVPDPAILADPNTLRNDPAHAPEIGKRRRMAPQP